MAGECIACDTTRTLNKDSEAAFELQVATIESTAVGSVGDGVTSDRELVSRVVPVGASDEGDAVVVGVGHLPVGNDGLGVVVLLVSRALKGCDKVVRPTWMAG